MYNAVALDVQCVLVSLADLACTGRTLQISILIMNLQKPRKYDVVKSSVFPMTGNVQNGISELKSHQ